MLRLTHFLAGAAAMLLLAPAPALAEADLLGWRGDLALWTIIIFVALIWVLRRTAWGPMLEGLQKREEMIRESVEEAKKTREDMEQLRLKFKQELDAAHAQIPALMDQARASAQRMAEEMRAKANEEIQSEKQRARHELEVARDQALQELWTQAAQLATLISAKAIRRTLSEEDHRRLVEEAMHEIGSANT